PSLRERSAPPRTARNEHRARVARLNLCRGARAAAPVARRRCGRRRDRALLRARDVGDGGRTLELPAARGARDLGGARRYALNRALDIAVAGTGLVLTSPLLALA